MKILFYLALNSLINRKITIILTIISISLSVTLFLSIEKLRLGAKQSFFGNVGNSDLILGAKSGEIQLLLYSLFQIGSPTNNFSWKTYQTISREQDIEWIVPISLGDSHKQFRVMGTTTEYFKYFKYKKNKNLTFEEGTVFSDRLEVVVGFEIAKQLNYKIGDNIIISHGIASQSFHDKYPFKISGILKKTGASLDRLVLVDLEALELIHIDWKTGVDVSKNVEVNKNISYDKLIPKEITAAIIKIKSPIKIFYLQRKINSFKNEAIQAIIPGMTINQLWQIVSITEKIMLIISGMVIVTALIGMTAILYSTLNDRKKEIALLRIVGAPPITIFSLLLMESVFISLISISFSVVIVHLLMIIMYPILDNMFGLFIEYTFLSRKDLMILLTVVFISCLVSIFPSFQAYKKSIGKGI